MKKRGRTATKKSIIEKYRIKMKKLTGKAHDLQKLEKRLKRLVNTDIIKKLISGSIDGDKKSDMTTLSKNVTKMQQLSNEILTENKECQRSLKKMNLEMKESIEDLEETMSFVVTAGQHYCRYNPEINRNDRLNFDP